jgi:hypothetical protein
METALANAIAPQHYQQYQNERAAQQNMAGQAPTLGGMDWTDIQNLQNVGQQQDALGQSQIDANIQKWNYNQNLAQNKLQQYAQLMGGLPFGTSQTSTQNPATSGTGSQLLGILGGLGTAALFSDRTLKEDIEPLEDALAKVEALQGVSFDWIGNAGGHREIGFVAQDVEAIVPEVVWNIPISEGETKLGIDYPKLTALWSRRSKPCRPRSRRWRPSRWPACSTTSCRTSWAAPRWGTSGRRQPDRLDPDADCRAVVRKPSSPYARIADAGRRSSCSRRCGGPLSGPLGGQQPASAFGSGAASHGLLGDSPLGNMLAGAFAGAGSVQPGQTGLAALGAGAQGALAADQQRQERQMRIFIGLDGASSNRNRAGEAAKAAALEKAIAGLSPEDQDRARADPDSFFAALNKAKFAGAEAPKTVGGMQFNPKTRPEAIPGYTEQAKAIAEGPGATSQGSVALTFWSRSPTRRHRQGRAGCQDHRLAASRQDRRQHLTGRRWLTSFNQSREGRSRRAPDARRAESVRCLSAHLADRPADTRAAAGRWRRRANDTAGATAACPSARSVILSRAGAACQPRQSAFAKWLRRDE